MCTRARAAGSTPTSAEPTSTRGPTSAGSTCAWRSSRRTSSSRRPSTMKTTAPPRSAIPPTPSRTTSADALEKHVLRQAAPAHDAPQLHKSFELNLAHALAREHEPRGELLEREQFPSVQAETPLDHGALLVVQLQEPFANERLDFVRMQLQLRPHAALVSDRLADREQRIDIERRIEGSDVLAARQQPTHFIGVLADEVRDVLRGRLALGVRLQMALRAKHGVQLLDHVHRQPDGARLVHDGALDVLPDPPGGIGGKPKATLGIELVERVHQPEIALLDEVQKRHASLEISLGDVDHQAQVMLDHFLPGGEIPGDGTPGKMQLLRGREQAIETDLMQIELGRVAEDIGFRGIFTRLPARGGFCEIGRASCRDRVEIAVGGDV